MISSLVSAGVPLITPVDWSVRPLGSAGVIWKAVPWAVMPNHVGLFSGIGTER